MDKNEIIHLAEISKIALSEEQMSIFESEMNEFLEMTELDKENISFEKENSIDFSDLREDEILQSEKEEVLNLAEKKEEKGFFVPKIL